MMKKGQWLILTISACVGLIVGSVYFYQNRSMRDDTNPGTAQEITINQVAQHNTKESCWLIINSKVFNATAYIAQHPDTTIVADCGTQLQTTDAKLIESLNSFYIGLLVP